MKMEQSIKKFDLKNDKVKTDGRTIPRNDETLKKEQNSVQKRAMSSVDGTFGASKKSSEVGCVKVLTLCFYFSS